MTGELVAVGGGRRRRGQHERLGASRSAADPPRHRAPRRPRPGPRRPGVGPAWAQLGLAPDRFAPGVAVGLAVSALVAAAVAVGVALPATRHTFLDSRYDVRLREAVRDGPRDDPAQHRRVEETAFRGVLWGEIERMPGGSRRPADRAVLFGVSHVLPVLTSRGRVTRSPAPAAFVPAHTASVVGVVVGTALAGVVLAELRRRTDHSSRRCSCTGPRTDARSSASSLAWARHRGSLAQDEVRPVYGKESEDVHPQGRE